MKSAQSKIFTGLALVLLLQCFFSNEIRAQDLPFSRGVNLTEWFQADAADKIPFTKFEKEDIADIKSLGFDVIRLPINLRHMSDGPPIYNLDPLFLNFLDLAVDWAEELEMHLILDNHSPDPNGETDPGVEKILEKIWSQMATRYKDRSEYIYYEILNEPHGITDQLWNAIQKKVVEKIREIDTTHYIVVGPASWNSYNNLEYMPLYEDDKLIYTFHFYDPFLFTHQGASWVTPSMEALEGIPFPYDADGMPELPSSLNGTWVASSYNNYDEDGTMEKVKELLDKAIQFRDERGVPIYCGEFGAYIPNCPEDSRVLYYDSLVSCLDSLDIPWTMWDYKGGYGLFEKDSKQIFEHDLNIPLLEAIGAEVPEQTVFIPRPDSTGFIMYSDYIEKSFLDASWPPEIPDFYSTSAPNNGNYCVHWTGAKTYEALIIAFSPSRDLTRLVEEGYALDFMVRGNDPDISFDVRFLDTKTDDPDDLPWRMGARLDGSKIEFNSTWQHVHIPLKDFTEGGSWYNEWFEPRGEFDWSAVDRFEIVPEVTDIGDKHVYFDNIHITNMDTAQVYEDSVLHYVSIEEAINPSSLMPELYPNPSSGILNLHFPANRQVTYSIRDLGGRELDHGTFTNRTTLDLAGFVDGIYILQISTPEQNRHFSKFILEK